MSLGDNLSIKGRSSDYLRDIYSPWATLNAKKKDHTQSVHIPVSRNVITQATWCKQQTLPLEYQFVMQRQSIRKFSFI